MERQEDGDVEHDRLHIVIREQGEWIQIGPADHIIAGPVKERRIHQQHIDDQGHPLFRLKDTQLQDHLEQQIEKDDMTEIQTEHLAF